MHTSFVTLQFRYLLDKVSENSSQNQAAEFNNTSETSGHVNWGERRRRRKPLFLSDNSAVRDYDDLVD